MSIKRSPEITDLLNSLLGVDMEECINNGICVICGGDAHDFINEISEAEFQISGTCQICQNEIFK